MSDPGLHYLPRSQKWQARNKLVNIYLQNCLTKVTGISAKDLNRIVKKSRQLNYSSSKWFKIRGLFSVSIEMKPLSELIKLFFKILVLCNDCTVLTGHCCEWNALLCDISGIIPFWRCILWLRIYYAFQTNKQGRRITVYLFDLHKVFPFLLYFSRTDRVDIWWWLRDNFAFFPIKTCCGKSNASLRQF